MAKESHCPQCGAELPANAPEGLCPQCLMKGALEPSADVTGDSLCVTKGPGTVVGRYELLEMIGEGGMGLVYLAEQKEPVKRRVALKIIKPGMDSKQVIARFEAERQVLALLDHPNIARVFDAGTTEAGRPYFVMEYVKGMSITRYCDRQKLDIEKRLKLFCQVCYAVQHAHQKGIIHRDIKPSNILVSVQDDRAMPKIIDFGVAKAVTQPLTARTLFTRHGQLLGTPEYMSPEQTDIGNRDIDTRADIYSLGVVLYELLTGVLPFERDMLKNKGFIEVQRILTEEEPPHPSIRLTSLGAEAKKIAESRHTQVITLARRLHRELEWIPLKAMRKDRSRRYRSASELADDIRNYLDGAPLLAGPETAVYRVKKFVQKHAGSVATVVLVAALIVLGLVVSSAMYFRAEKALQKEAVARGVAEEARAAEAKQRHIAEEETKRANELAETQRKQLYFNHIALADVACRDNSIRRVRELLESCPEDLRGWEWYRLNHISDQSYITIYGLEGYKMAISPDGRRVAAGGNGNTVKVWDTTTGVELMSLHGHDRLVSNVKFSSDGKRIVSGSHDITIKVWDAENAIELMTLKGHEASGGAHFSPDGTRIISGSRDGTLRIWNAETGIELRTWRAHEEGGGRCHTISPDGRYIASGGSDGVIRLWDAATGDKVMTLRGHESDVISVAFSPDGKRLASASSDTTIKVWDAVTGAEVMTLRGHKGFVRCVAFSPDGKRIVSGSGDNTIKLWDAITGAEVMILRGHRDQVWSVAFSSDGKRVISSSEDKTIKVWDAAIDHERMHIGDEVWGKVSFSPDGKRIFSACLDGVVTVWDRSSGAELMTLRGHEGGLTGAYCSPDGKRIFLCQYNVTKVWDAATGDEVMNLRKQDRWLCATFSPDSKRIACWSVDYSWDNYDDIIELRDAATGKKLMNLHGHRVTSAAFSPDGKHIVSGSDDGTITVWDAETGEKTITRRYEVGVFEVAFSPDGKRIISVGWDGIVKLWDADTFSEVMILPKNERRISSIAFSPDGKRIVLGDRGGMVKIWNVATGTEVMTLRELGKKGWQDIPGVAFSADGKTIAIGGSNGITLLESEAPVDGYETRRTGNAARKIVDELYEKHGLYQKVIDELKADETLEEAVRKMALQIANARLWEDAEKLKKRGSDSAGPNEETTQQEPNEK